MRAQLRRDRRRRRLLDDLLVPPLGAAVALAEVDARAVRVEQHLTSTWRDPLEEALEDEPVVAERRARLAARRPAPRQAVGVGDDAHALAAAAGGGLDQQRVADAAPPRGQRRRPARRRRSRGSTGTPARPRAAGRGLVAHGRDGVRRRADPGEAGVDDRSREVGVLGEEAVAGMDRVGAGPRRRPSSSSSASRYEPVGMASSTPAGGRSSAAWTPTTRMPMRRAVAATRTAISPRLATSSVRIGPAGRVLA